MVASSIVDTCLGIEGYRTFEADMDNKSKMTLTITNEKMKEEQKVFSWISPALKKKGGHKEMSENRERTFTCYSPIPLAKGGIQEFLENRIDFKGKDLDVNSIMVFLYGTTTQNWVTNLFDTLKHQLPLIDEYSEANFMSFGIQGRSPITVSKNLLFAQADFSDLANNWYSAFTALYSLCEIKKYRVIFTNNIDVVNQLYLKNKIKKVDGGVSFFNFEEDKVGIFTEGVSTVSMKEYEGLLSEH